MPMLYTKSQVHGISMLSSGKLQSFDWELCILTD